MKLVSLQISNVLSFEHYDDVATAPLISFDDDLNIIIGENGSGKSTALEVINFLFKRVLYRQYVFNQDIYGRRTSATVDERRQIIMPANQNTFAGFRLEPNWNTPTSPQSIRVVLKLDSIDRANMELLHRHSAQLETVSKQYTQRQIPAHESTADKYILDIKLHREGQAFETAFVDCQRDFGFEYLSEYHFYKESIALYNLENPSLQIPPLFESFSLISSYRNYHGFSTGVTLRDASASRQMQQIRGADYTRSLNLSDAAEPSIFGLVRLRVAEKHFELFAQKLSPEEREAAANSLTFLARINERLRIVHLSCKISLSNLQSWQYSFEFYDTRRNKAISDVNQLSAGQKAIVHLVFEAYGRDDIKGGLVIIDEPEIHLHYQFQHEYLQVVRELNRDQSCQYILVTHSEALINSSTINCVRRFAMSPEGYTRVFAPTLSTEEKVLIRILDNTRSTYAFFARKVVLVEGDDDRYFYRAVMQRLHPGRDQEIAILRVGGRKEMHHWTSLFEAFGLIVYRIGDLDCCYQYFYTGEQERKLDTAQKVADFKKQHLDCEDLIIGEYPSRTYILRNGDLEHYLAIRKDPANVIAFCNDQLAGYLSREDSEPAEIRRIINAIAA
jgi:predicted ATP-dependent endonuclease of OLD family